MTRSYRVEKVLGQGGYARVLLVVDRDGQRFAMKQVLEQRRDFVEALRSEAEKLSSLRDEPGVIRLLSARFDCDRPYLILELAECSLLDLITGPIPAPTVAGLGLHLVASIRRVHAHGVVHRDIKPDNILLRDGALKVADFGLGRGASSLLLTMGGVGTPGYMAPEQQFGPAGSGADVYGLGATFFHMLVGTRPPDDLAQLDPRAWVPSVSPEMATLVARMTALSVSDRPTLDEVEATLHRVLVVASAPPPSLAKRSTGWAPIVGLGLLAVSAIALLGGKGR